MNDEAFQEYTNKLAGEVMAILTPHHRMTRDEVMAKVCSRLSELEKREREAAQSPTRKETR